MLRYKMDQNKFSENAIIYSFIDISKLISFFRRFGCTGLIWSDSITFNTWYQFIEFSPNIAHLPVIDKRIHDVVQVEDQSENSVYDQDCVGSMVDQDKPHDLNR